MVCGVLLFVFVRGLSCCLCVTTFFWPGSCRVERGRRRICTRQLAKHKYPRNKKKSEGEKERERQLKKNSCLVERGEGREERENTPFLFPRERKKNTYKKKVGWMRGRKE